MLLVNVKTIYITKQEAEDGLTLKLKRGTVVKVRGWINKHGTDILLVAKSTGMYKIHGKVEDVQ